jgi:hypothetical protein
MTLKNYVMVGLSAFVSGAAASLATVPTSALLSEATAKPFLVGAVMAGIVAVVHLYQPVPAVTK